MKKIERTSVALLSEMESLHIYGGFFSMTDNGSGNLILESDPDCNQASCKPKTVCTNNTCIWNVCACDRFKCDDKPKSLCIE